jgi:hypothetical protein
VSPEVGQAGERCSLRISSARMSAIQVNCGPITTAVSTTPFSRCQHPALPRRSRRDPWAAETAEMDEGSIERAVHEYDPCPGRTVSQLRKSSPS